MGIKNFAIKIYNNDQLMLCTTRKTKRRFMKILRTINWNNKDTKVNLKITYSDNETNECECFNKDDFYLAFDAFCEG